MKLPTVQIKKILYATDLSETSVHAFTYAVSLADTYGASITILHVFSGFIGETYVTSMINPDTWKEIQEKQVEMRQFEYSSQLQVQSWSDIPRGTPLYESVIVFENAPIDASVGKTALFEGLSNVTSVSHTDMPLHFRAHPGSKMMLDLIYDTSRFDEATITAMLEQLQTLFAQMVEDPDRELSSFTLLDTNQRREIAQRQNRIGPTNAFEPFPDEAIEQTVCARFEQQVARSPQALAVVTPKERTTYEQLAEQVDRIACAIVNRLGPGQGQVALLLGHTASTPAAMLGALKAGKTYVPLDPAYPTQRLVTILEDSQAKALITDQSNMALAETLVGDKMLLIDIDRIDGESAAGVKAEITPDSLAYILYTSGSTGKPKGVMQNHRNVLHHIRTYTNSLHIGQADKLTLLSSYTFDAAVMDIYGALLNGATLYPYNIREHGLDDLAAWLDDREVTLFHSTPTVYRYFSGSIRQGGSFASIRAVVMGGEEVTQHDVELYRENFSPSCLFVNGLGPSESTLALQYFIDRQTPLGRSSVPVGYGVANTDAILLDENGKESDLHGEIGIRSAYVALGYWRLPEATESAFLNDGTGRRIYRTGDLGRRLPDGSIEFVGRKDKQVKIRGFRIEPGEIDAVLSGHPDVERVAVVTRDNEQGEKMLVAYVVGEESEGVSAAGLRQFVAKSLPDYMVPAAIVLLDVLPMTPNGKLDREALPDPRTVLSETHQDDREPRSEIEQILIEIWIDILRVDRPGVNDNFFELGGHSLLATRLVTQVRKQLEVELPLRCVFENQTIARQAVAIEDLLMQEIENLSDEEAMEMIRNEN